MKNILIVLFIFASLQFSFSQSGWVWQNPLPQGNTLRSLTFINNEIGLAVGDLGAIVRTLNGGTDWESISLVNAKNLNSITHSLSNVLLVCGDSGIILKSTNNGLNWETRQSGTNVNLARVILIDDNTGYVAGNAGTVLRTTDQGNSWTQIQTGTTHNLYTIYFRNVNTGYLSGSSVFEITNNGGISWSTYNLPSGVSFRDLTFINDTLGFAAGYFDHFPTSNAIVYRTTNGGFNWNQTSSSGGPTFYSVTFRDFNTGFVAGAYGIIFTTNSGINWSTTYWVSINHYLATAFKGNVGIVAGWGGNILSTTNFGLSWTNHTNSFSGFAFSDVFFVDRNVGYACGNEPGDSCLAKTTNSGINWIQLRGPTNSFNFSIFFNNANTGYIVKGSNFIYKTTDGGISWVSYSTGSSSGFRKIYFTDLNNGIAGGYEGIIYRTSNAGNNWALIGSFGGTVYDISFPNNLTGYAVGVTYGIIKTVNGGYSWSNLPAVPNMSYIPNVYFINATTGFISGDQSPGGHTILKTTDGGSSWQTIFFDLYHRINKICIRQTGIGFGVGDNGTIIKTENFGNNWYYLNSNTNNSLFSLAQIDDSLCFAVGEEKTILCTSDGGGNPLAITQSSTSVSSSFVLQQNFPNPFNPVTKIKYDLPTATIAKLVIYDILGREVATLVNEQLKPGSYEAEWDGSNYASGIYFYSLKTEQFSETKKMVLMK